MLRFQVQYVWFMLLYCAYMAVLLAIGSAVNIGFFRKNSYGLQIVSGRVRGPCCHVLQGAQAVVYAINYLWNRLLSVEITAGSTALCDARPAPAR